MALLLVGAGPAGAGEDPTTHPDPLPLSKIRPGHPRLWFNSDSVHTLQKRWTDPAFANIVDKYKGKTDAISLALEGLATGDTAKCSRAAEIVDSSYRPSGDVEAGHVVRGHFSRRRDIQWRYARDSERGFPRDWCCLRFRRCACTGQ